MRATTIHAPYDMRVEDVPEPVVQLPTDAVVRVLRACICGSDLWAYRGEAARQPGQRIGHEFLGVVEETGSEVSGFRRGDLVVAPFMWSDGVCVYCREGLTTSCAHGGFWGSVGHDGGPGAEPGGGAVGHGREQGAVAGDGDAQVRREVRPQQGDRGGEGDGVGRGEETATRVWSAVAQEQRDVADVPGREGGHPGEERRVGVGQEQDVAAPAEQESGEQESGGAARAGVGGEERHEKRFGDGVAGLEAHGEGHEVGEGGHGEEAEQPSRPGALGPRHADARRADA
jgi:hypothetical protein